MKHILSFLILLCTILFLSPIVNAQVNYEDVVYLKNGSIIHGVIIEQIPGVSIKIQTKDRNIFVYKMDEVLKMTKEEIPEVKKGREAITKDNMKKKGFLSITEITVGRNIRGNQNDDDNNSNNTSSFEPSVGVQVINGYLFNPHISAGLGLGFHIYNGGGFVPIFADARFNFLNGPRTPFLAADAGYSFTIKEVYGIGNDEKYFGGIYLNPAAGIKFHTRRALSMEFSIGYRYQEMRALVEHHTESYPYVYFETWENRVLGYLNLKVGFAF